MSKEELKIIAKYATQKNIDIFYPFLDKYMKEYCIVGKRREAAFIAQIIHESGSFKYVKELASGEAYEGRKDLGNTQPGDGVKYKGRGLIQITGRANYKEISNAFDIDFISNPQLLEQPELAVKSACWWWNSRNLNTLADEATKESFKQITKKINGGYNGLADRETFYELALKTID